MEFLSLEAGNLRLNHLLQVVAEDVGGHADGNALRPRHQHHRQLGREDHRLLVATVVGGHVLGYGRIVQHPLCQGLETALDVTGGGSPIPGVQVAEVPLLVDEQLLVCQHHQGRADGGIAMGMVLHALPHYVGHLVVASVVHGEHGVEDAALHRLEAVLNVGDGPVTDDVAGVLDEVFVEDILYVGHDLPCLVWR